MTLAKGWRLRCLKSENLLYAVLVLLGRALSRRRRVGCRAQHRSTNPVTSVRLGFLLLLLLQWGPLQGALPEDAVPAECHPAYVDTSHNCVIDAIPEEGADVALAADVWRDERPVSGSAPSSEAEAAESDRQSDGGTADGSTRERVAAAVQGGSQSAIVGVLVTLTFGIFGLLFVTRRRFSHDG